MPGFLRLLTKLTAYRLIATVRYAGNILDCFVATFLAMTGETCSSQ